MIENDKIIRPSELEGSDEAPGRDNLQAVINMQENRIRDLSMIIRRMANYATTREPSIACEKIADLHSKAQHLLAESSILRRSNDTERGTESRLENLDQGEG